MRGPLAAVKGRMPDRLWALVSAKVVVLAIGAATSLGLALLLPPVVRGQVGSLISAATLVGLLVHGSLHIVGTNVAAEHRESWAADATIRITAIVALCAVVLGWGMWALGFQLGDYDEHQIAIALTGGALVAIFTNSSRLIQGLGFAGQYRFLTISMTAATAGAALTGSFFGLTASAIVVMWSAAYSLIAVIAVVQQQRIFRDLPPVLNEAPVRAVGQVLRGAFGPHLVTVGQQLAFRLDIVLLGALRGDDPLVGSYVVASSLGEVMLVAPEALALYAFDSKTRQSFYGTRGGHLKLRRRASPVIWILGAAIPVLALGLQKALLQDYQYLPLLVAVLAPGLIAASFARLDLAWLLRSHGDRRLLLVSIANALLAVGYLPAIAVGGAFGAAIMSSALYIITAVVARRLVDRESR